MQFALAGALVASILAVAAPSLAARHATHAELGHVAALWGAAAGSSEFAGRDMVSADSAPPPAASDLLTGE